MSHKVRWLVKDHVLLSVFDGNMDEDTLTTFIADIKPYFEASPIPLHHISDSLKMGKVSLNFRTLKALAGAMSIASKIGWQIDINTNPMNRMFSSIASQFANVRFRTFNTFDEGLDFLRSHTVGLENAVWLMEDN